MLKETLASHRLAIITTTLTVLSVVVSIASAYFAFTALRDVRTFAFSISCGPVSDTAPDEIKPLLLGGINFPTFSANGDKKLGNKTAAAACTVYNLSKEPVPRLSFVIFVSSPKDSKRVWRQDVMMEPFEPESSRVLWLSSGDRKSVIHAVVGDVVRYIDPLDGKSYLAHIPAPLANLNLYPNPTPTLPSNTSSARHSQSK